MSKSSSDTQPVMTSDELHEMVATGATTSDGMPANYCTTDHADFLSGNLERTISFDLQMQKAFSDQMEACRKEAGRWRDIFRMANFVDPHTIVPEHFADAMFSKGSFNHYALVKRIYEFMTAEDPKRALYLKIRALQIRECPSCDVTTFVGTGHDEGCGSDDHLAIERYTGKAIRELAYPMYNHLVDEDTLKPVMQAYFNRTAQQITQTAERRALNGVEDVSDLAGDPLATSIDVQTTVHKLFLMAKANPTGALIRYISYICKMRCMRCRGLHELGTPEADRLTCEEGCAKPWHHWVDQLFEEACQTLQIKSLSSKDYKAFIRGMY